MKPHRGIWLVLMLILMAPPASAMNLDDVFSLLHAGVGEDVILKQMDSEGSSFLLETDDILALRRAGASDDLLRAMIESADTRRSERDAVEDAPRSDEDWTEDYYAVDRDLRVDIVYDPFGYHWYASPSYFVYYYPFRSWDVGCYYAGWYHWRWWGWNGYWPNYYRDYCDSYYWRHNRRTYYHAQDNHDYRDNVRYRSRYDRAADGKPSHDRTRATVEGRDRVTRSRSPRDADLDGSRTRTNTPAVRDRSRERSQEPSRTRSPRVAPRADSGGRSTPSQPSRSRSSSESSRSDSPSRGRSR